MSFQGHATMRRLTTGKPTRPGLQSAGAAIWLWLAAIIAVSPARPANAQASVPSGAGTVSVFGEGEVSAIPDTAHFVIGISFQAESAGATLRGYSDAAAALTATLRSEGIRGGDIQTSSLDLSPRFAPRANAAEPRSVVGFAASSHLNVVVRDLGILGPLLDQLAGRGVRDIRLVRFEVSNRHNLLEEARRRAVQDAKRRASAYADAAGVSLGPLQSLAEEASVVRSEFAPMSSAEVPSAIHTEPGEAALRVRVQTIWQIGR